LKKPTLYLETTIPSYLTALPTRDVVALAHQEITREWWKKRRQNYDIYISSVVLEEIKMGASNAVEKRLQIVSNFKILKASPEVEAIAKIYLSELNFPQKAIRDAAHLAFACIYKLDYLLTWNCAHIANAEVRSQLFKINSKRNIWTPTICTPEELMGI